MSLARQAKAVRRQFHMLDESREVRVSRGDSRRDGSCNGCNQVNEFGQIPYDTVLVIQLRGMSFRLCFGCASEMLRQMEDRA